MAAKYRIAPDIYGFAIEERRVAGERATEPGKVTWTPVEWPGNLEQTAQRLLHLLTVSKAENAEIASARELIDAITEARADVQKIVREAQS